MSGFNTSTRKEDVSLRLRAKNLKNARDQTKRLEEDNRKMEERLKELKTAMNREKEERERQGGGFWGRGQTQAGSLTNYASEVLHSKAEKPPKEGKKKKVKVLQDEPIDVPKRSNQPGTMKYIAQRKLTSGATPRDKLKGPKCGQCEDRTATLSCVQCSEIYCPGCFAAFHLKGALKQHRSVPLSASGPRVCMSPSTSVDMQSPRGSQASGVVPTQSLSGTNGSEAAGPTSARSVTNSNTPSLLQGDYDESQSAASFQQALLAWRQGEQPVTQQESPRKPVASPVKSPVIAVDESTGTPEQVKIPEIKFKSTLSYAERLMLKKHRRSEVAETNTPRLDGQSQISSASDSRSGSTPRSFDQRDTISDRPNSQSRSLGSFSIKNLGNKEASFIDDEEHVDFRSLYEAVASSASPDRGVQVYSSHSDVSVTELQYNGPNSSAMPHLKSSNTYVVEEVSPFESWKTEQEMRSGIASSPSAFDKPQVSRFQNSSYSNRPHMEKITEMYKANDSPSDASTGVALESVLNKKIQGSESDYIDDPSTESPLPSSRSKSRKQNISSSKHPFKEEIDDVNKTYIATSPDDKPPKTPARPKSRKSGSATSRGKSDKMSRASSRLGGEGHLTKAPSESLSKVAHMVQSTEHTYTYQSPLEGFFLVGVEGEQPSSHEERVLTPSNGRKTPSRPKSRAEALKSARGQKETIKVSNRLYQMAPKSWRPDSSLGDTVPLSEVKVDGTDPEVTMSYTYSGEVTGQPVEWRPSSSQSRVEFPSDNLGLNSMLTFGDEMFTEEAAASSAAGASRTSFVRSSNDSVEYGQGDSPQFGMIRNSFGNTTPTPTPPSQARQKSAGRRSRNIITPTNVSSESYGTSSPVPPSSRFTSQRSSLESSTPTPRASKQNTKAETVSSARHSARDPKFTETRESSSLSHHSQGRLSQPSSAGAKGKTGDLKNKTSYQDSVQKSREITPISRQGSHHSTTQRAVSRHKSDVASSHRPSSSTMLPAASQAQQRQLPRGELRPNSSTGGSGSEPLRRTQPSMSDTVVQQHEDTVIADMMMSRVQEDGWTGQDPDFIHNSYDYDDGDGLTPESLMQHNIKLYQMTDKKSGEQWETEVRPFTGRSIDSRTSFSSNKFASAKGAVKASRPLSSRPSSAMTQGSGRESRAVVMDGEDLSHYDNVGVSDEQNREDKQTLDQLEWELASDTGRLTADGQISRMEMLEDENLVRGSSSKTYGSSHRMSKEYNLAAELEEDERRAEHDVDHHELRRSVTLDEDEVRALR